MKGLTKITFKISKSHQFIYRHFLRREGGGQVERKEAFKGKKEAGMEEILPVLFKPPMIRSFFTKISYINLTNAMLMSS